MGCLKLAYRTDYTALKVVQGGLYGSEKGCAGSYRYGFNGKENDNEVYGTGNWQDYGMRIYDPRLGRFASADPLIVKGQQYAWYSPYHFAGNTPIMAIDLDGLEEKVVITRITYGSTNFDETRVVNYEYIEANRETNREIFDRYSELGKYGKRGTLAVFEQEGKQTIYAFGINNWDKALNWVEENTPQVLVYGSGDLSTSLGEKADPNKKLYSVNFSELSDYLNLFSMIAAGNINKPEDIAVPDALEFLKDIADAVFEAHKQQERSKPSSSTTVFPTTVHCRTCKKNYSTNPNTKQATPDESIEIPQDTIDKHGDEVQSK